MGLGRGLAQRRPTSARRRGRFDAGAWTRGARLLAAAHVPLQPRGRVGERSISNPNRRRGPPPLVRAPYPARTLLALRPGSAMPSPRCHLGWAVGWSFSPPPPPPHYVLRALTPGRALLLRARSLVELAASAGCAGVEVAGLRAARPEGPVFLTLVQEQDLQTLAVAVAEAARSRGLAACLVGGTSNTLLVRGPARHRPGLYIWLELSVARAPLAR
mmetsp:Transcript_17944/g.58098  ORF Transcript_17944/g.58098 Transcript_17944/m.58098 type:complete len:216 (+) Transcript_17944:356-1003(+)